jgi:hypothetical protein
VAFRNRTDTEIRDIHVSRVENSGWTGPAAVHDDGWSIPACPVNGPMVRARGRHVAIAWFTVRDGVGHAYVGFSSDGGRSFGMPIRVDGTAALGRVGIEWLPDGSAVATWIEIADKRAAFSARRVDPSGGTSGIVTVSEVGGSRASGYPRIARFENALIFAWTYGAEDTSRVRTSVSRLHR